MDILKTTVFLHCRTHRRRSCHQKEDWGRWRMEKEVEVQPVLLRDVAKVIRAPNESVVEGLTSRTRASKYSSVFRDIVLVYFSNPLFSFVSQCEQLMRQVASLMF